MSVLNHYTLGVGITIHDADASIAAQKLVRLGLETNMLLLYEATDILEVVVGLLSYCNRASNH